MSKAAPQAGSMGPIASTPDGRGASKTAPLPGWKAHPHMILPTEACDRAADITAVWIDEQHTFPSEAWDRLKRHTAGSWFGIDYGVEHMNISREEIARVAYETAMHDQPGATPWGPLPSTGDDGHAGPDTKAFWRQEVESRLAALDAEKPEGIMGMVHTLIAKLARYL